jgi:tRNA (guanine26-N2/guanine27-N2)-dimethyltransferase
MVQPATENGFPTEIIREGKIQIVAPKLSAYGVIPSDYAPSRAPVFYNPIMELNRDLTVLAFQAYQRVANREVTICEPLTGTGIRGIRFAAEIQGVKTVVSVDINMRSAKLATQNVELNGLQEKVSVKHKDANRLLAEHSSPKKRFDIVDIDPFGTPVPHLDAAVQALRNKGLLATTATDMAPLCGVHPKACIRKYGGRPMRTEYCQELAVRLLTGAVASTAARHEIGTRVMFSHCSNHYIRVYTQIDYGAQKADESLRQLGYVLHCFKCLHRETARNPFKASKVCPECGNQMDHAGPLWLDAIADRQFTELMLVENGARAFRSSAKITKLLTLIRDEAQAPITYHVLDRLSQKLKLPAPATAAFLQALREGGFQAVLTHFNPRGIRTEAPAMSLHRILRAITSKSNPQ